MATDICRPPTAYLPHRTLPFIDSAQASGAYGYQQYQHQNGQQPSAYYSQQQQQQQQQQQSNRAQAQHSINQGVGPSADQSEMLILQHQSYMPQAPEQGPIMDRGGHPQGRNQYHPNVPNKAILYGSYVDPNMIQPTSRNTSPGNNETDRKSHTNLYIRGLLPTDTDETIRKLVSDNANIASDAINSTKAVLDEQTGNCKGYGFVDFRDEKQAQLALESLTKTSLRNGKLQISYARESEKDPTNIYIKNLPTRVECDEAWMSKVFGDDLAKVVTGRIISCRVMRATDPSTRQQTSATGAGFIRFEKDQDALTAIHHINSNGMALGQKYGSPRPLEAKLADKTNQRKKQRAQTAAQQPGLAQSVGPSQQLASSPQLQLGFLQQNPQMARGAVLPGSYSVASALSAAAAPTLYNPVAPQSTSLTAYTNRLTPAVQASAAPTSYVFQHSVPQAHNGAQNIYQQRNSYIFDPSYTNLYAAQPMMAAAAAAAAAAAGPQSLYAPAEPTPIAYYAPTLDPNAATYQHIGLTAAAEQQ